MTDITVIILTRNEQLHIARCIKSVKPIASGVLVVDSGSTDRTTEIAASLGAQVVTHAFTTHAEQFNWALDNAPIYSTWIMRLDADEYILPELAAEIAQRLPSLQEDITGVNLRRRVVFMGRWIKHGGYYPIILLRLFRRGKARSEQRRMDEHIRIVEGRTISFAQDFVDENLNDLTWWTEKHNHYATREAADLLALKQGVHEPEVEGFRETTRQAERKRWLKEKVYARLPLGLRPLLYYLYRMFIRLGVLDGWQGLIWHTLQGFWYRFLVDAKFAQLQRTVQVRGGGSGNERKGK